MAAPCPSRQQALVFIRRWHRRPVLVGHSFLSALIIINQSACQRRSDAATWLGSAILVRRADQASRVEPSRPQLAETLVGQPCPNRTQPTATARQSRSRSSRHIPVLVSSRLPSHSCFRQPSIAYQSMELAVYDKASWDSETDQRQSRGP